jgi:hypothetical protein
MIESWEQYDLIWFALTSNGSEMRARGIGGDSSVLRKR